MKNSMCVCAVPTAVLPHSWASEEGGHDVSRIATISAL